MGSKRGLLPRHAGLIAALLLGAACAADEPDPPAAASCSSIEPGNERVDLGDRWYLRRVPSAHDGSTPVPVVIDLHGYSEGAELHERRTGLAELGEDEGFVTVTPHALGDPPAWDLDVDGVDVAFVRAVLDDVDASLCVDVDRVFVTGHSMGGFLISSLACADLTTRIAAYAPVSGVRLVEPCAPSRHAPALVIHGTADDVVLYDGGLNALAAELLALPEDGPSVPAIVEGWSARDPAVDVELHAIDGWSHDWPPEANDLIWSFFERHPR